MIKYILKRLLFFIPTLIVISLLAFFFSIEAPGDPVEILSGEAGAQGGNTRSQVSKATKDTLRTRLGLDKPVFYFALTTLADCDTLYRVTDRAHRETLARLTRKSGNWEKVSAFHLALKNNYESQFSVSVDSVASIYVADENDTLKDTSSYLVVTPLHSSPAPPFSKTVISDMHNQACNLLITLLETYRSDLLEARMDSLEKVYESAFYFEKQRNDFGKVKSAFAEMKSSTTTWKNYIPSMKWYGFDNQYNNWLWRLVSEGDFGYSYVDHEPISSRIWEKFWISFKLIFLSVVLAYLVSIPVGVYSAKHKDGWFDRIASVLLFMLYSLPSFFVGMLLLFFFANPDYFVWFPESGYMDPAVYNPEWNFVKRFIHQWPFMVLPLIAYTYSTFAFISRITRSSMIETLSMDYVRTARAKGLAEKNVIWKHAFRNSLIPVITMFVNIFPAAIGGSVIIETIFTYPGMGLASYDAIHNHDYPSIVAIFTLAGFLTMVGYLVADILYAWADPRISFGKK
jgi:peptide/nickel transport system permease protein